MRTPSASPSTPSTNALGESKPDGLAAAQDRFILLWSQMASNWGIPPSMAQVHALLLINGRPMNADEITASLGISRGSASLTVRSLMEWGIVSRVRVRGERREYFTAEQDLWKLFRTVLRERKKRELDPLLEALRDCREMTDAPDKRRRIDPEIDSHNERLDSMLEFLEMIDAISNHLIHSSGKGLALAAKIFAKAS